jgi:DNA polymerase
MSSPRTFIVDFETFFDSKGGYTLRKMSGPEYILDPRFKVHGLAVDDGEKQHWFTPDRIPAVLKRMESDILVAHRGYFDFGILAWRYKFRPAYMVDTLALANHVLGAAIETHEQNDLASLANRLGLEAKGRELEIVDGIADPDEAQLAALAAYAKRDVRIERQVLDTLLPQVTNQDFELWLIDHTFRIYTERMLPINVEKITATIAKIEQRREELLKAGDASREVLASNKQFALELESRLKEAKLKLPMKRSPRTGKMAPALAKLDTAFIKLAEHENARIADLVKARLVVRSAANAIARLKTMQMYHTLGIGLPVHLNYYGAHTGRFSGGGGFNFQNFANPERATDPVEREIAQMIRDAIEAGEGHVFVADDAAQIEARVLAWLAGEDSILEEFATGADLYAIFISEVLGERIVKPTKEMEKADPAVYKHNWLMRFVGKESVLGLGYQMGVDKFVQQLKAKSRDVAKMFEAGKLTPEFVGEVVKAYRDKYTHITALWGRLEKAFHGARVGGIRKVGPVTFKKIGNRAVGVVLPSGRMLTYRGVHSEKYSGRPSFTGVGGTMVRAKTLRLEWKHGAGQKVYGGLLAENIVQAISRDILAEAIFKAEQAGYPVALHIHDEIICRVPQDKGQECLTFLSTALSTPPPWGEGMVLGAEGRVVKGLGK